MRQCPEQKMHRHPVSSREFCCQSFLLVQSYQNNYQVFELFKVIKITTYFFDLFKISKILRSSHPWSSHPTQNKIKAHHNSSIKLSAPANFLRTQDKKDKSFTNHLIIHFKNFSILCCENDAFKLSLRESILIKRDSPELNRNVSSMPLLLFN